MKGYHEKIYLATEGKDLANPNENDFNIILSEPPQVLMYKEYVGVWVVKEMLEKLKTVCGGRAMRYVEKQMKIINGS